MKKLLASILLVIYLVSTCAVVINFHYCMDRLASTSLFGNDGSVCGECGMHNDNSDGCCRDEIKVVKLEQDQQKSQGFDLEILKAPDAGIKYASAYLDLPFQNTELTKHFLNHSPPLLSGQDIYLENGVFRI